MKRLAANLVLLLLVAAVAARAGGEPSLDEVLALVEAKGKNVRDFRARFRQEKTVYLLDEPIRSEGRILYRRPNRLRWETERPQRSTLVIDDAGMKIHLPELAQVEVYEFSGRDALGAILPLFGQSVEDLKRTYEVALAPPADPSVHTLTLVPKNERLKRAIARLEVSVDRETLLPRRLAYHDPSGDVATTTFESVETNVGLEESDFKLDLPPGTKVKKPLGGLPF